MSDIQTQANPGVETTAPSAPATPASELSVMAQAMVDFGHWTSEQAQQALAAEQAAGPDTGLDPLAPPAQKPAAPEGVDPIDALAFEGPTSPGAYQFAPAPEGVEQDAAQDLAIRNVFHAEQVPVTIAKEVSRLYAEAAKAPPTDAQVEIMGQQTMQQLEKMYGADTKRYLDAARGEVQRMAARDARIHTMLNESGLGSNLFVVNSLINLARARGRVK